MRSQEEIQEEIDKMERFIKVKKKEISWYEKQAEKHAVQMNDDAVDTMEKLTECHIKACQIMNERLQLLKWVLA